MSSRNKVGLDKVLNPDRKMEDTQDSLAQEGRMGEAGIKRQEGRRGWLGTGAPQEGIRRASMT